MKRSLALLLTLALLAAPVTAASVQCKSLAAQGEGTRLSYELTGAGSVTAVAALYTKEDKLLETKITALELAGGAVQTATVLFAANLQDAYAKVFALEDGEKLLPGGADRVSLAAGGPDEPDEPWRLRYDFSKAPYSALGSVEETKTVEGLRLNHAAGTTRTMTVSGGSLKFSGAGEVSDCSVTVAVPGPCTVSVTAESGNTEQERAVRIVDSAGEKLADLPFAAKATGTYEYTGPAGELTFFSAGSGVKLYVVELVHGDAPETDWSLEYDFSKAPYSALGTLSAYKEAGGLKVNIDGSDAQKRTVSVANGCIAFPGGGNLTNFSVTVTPKGPCNVQVTYASGNASDARTLHVIVPPAGELGTGTELYAFPATATKTTRTWQYTGKGEPLTFCSVSKGMNLYSIKLFTGDAPEEPKEPTVETYIPGELPYDPSGQPETPTQVIHAATQAELEAAIASAQDGALIQLAGGTIECAGTIRIATSKHLTIAGSQEETTILDYFKYSDSLMNTAAEVSNRGINVTGSYIAFKNFIIQGAAGTAINLTGESCHHILIQDVVTRYNHNSGIYVQDGAHDVTLRHVDSYRNCDIYKKGQDADGFSVSINCGKNLVLDNCRAFENADDAYDNFNNHWDVTYLNCYAWNNGGIDVYTGKYDFDRGRPMDEKLPLLRWMMKSSPEFAAALKAGRYELPGSLSMNVRTQGEVTLKDYVGDVWEGNGNGFKLGSGDQSWNGRPQVKAEAYRRLENCISFDNAAAKGFDRNNGLPTVEVKNFFSFSNQSNYWAEGLTVRSLSGVYSYDCGSRGDITDKNFPIQTLSKTQGKAAADSVRQQADALWERLCRDEIVGEYIIDPGIWK